jgi:putative transposase
MEDHATEVALFRYSLVRCLVDESLSGAERGRLARELAGTAHLGPGGTEVYVSRATIDRWTRMLRSGGFAALKPEARHANPRTPEELLDLACRLRRERPERTAAHICELLRTVGGWAPHERTLQRHFVRVGLARSESRPKLAFGRFEADRPNELWTGDALHGPVIGGRKTYLFAFIDDYSRTLVGYRWGHAEDTLRLEAALRSGIERRGIPEAIYLDNGSAMVSVQLLRACAVLGMKLHHSKPGRPEGRGKIERVFKTVREQFLVELDPVKVCDLDEMNSLFSAFVESVYHRRRHTETGEAPIERFLAGGAPSSPPSAEQLHEAFLWAERRMVTKTGTVNLFGNSYEVDPALIGRRVELVFDPFHLEAVEVRFEGRPMGEAVPHVTRRHSHPRVAKDPEPPPMPTGIDYLALIEARHSEEMAKRIVYTDLADGAGPSEEDMDGIVITRPASWDLVTDRPIETREGQP